MYQLAGLSVIGAAAHLSRSMLRNLRVNYCASPQQLRGRGKASERSPRQADVPKSLWVYLHAAAPSFAE